MNTPMALLEMEPVELEEQDLSEPTDWTWTPNVKDPTRLAKALTASSQTTRNTFRDQLDHGETK